LFRYAWVVDVGHASLLSTFHVAMPNVLMLGSALPLFISRRFLRVSMGPNVWRLNLCVLIGLVLNLSHGLTDQNVNVESANVLCLLPQCRLCSRVSYTCSARFVAWVSALGVWEIPISSHVDAH